MPSQFRGMDDKLGDIRTERRGEGRPKALKPPKRSSKHAPTEQSAKRRVPSRLRGAGPVAAKQLRGRDPRFFAPSTASDNPRLDAIKAEKNYAFLDGYRDSEMAALRGALGKTKDADEREALSRALLSMESRRKANKRRREEAEVVASHRRQERELVRQGKKPFYLKRSEQKKQVLVKRFTGMSGKQVDKAMARREKKLASKEKRRGYLDQKGQSRSDGRGD
jgi:ribosomal RNA-processing protein 36